MGGTFVVHPPPTQRTQVVIIQATRTQKLELTPELEADFWSKTTRATAKADECWLWTSVVLHAHGRDNPATGIYNYQSAKTISAHRMAYCLAAGDSGTGLAKVMRCPINSICCNPAHLVPKLRTVFSPSPVWNNKKAEQGLHIPLELQHLAHAQGLDVPEPSGPMFRQRAAVKPTYTPDVKPEPTSEDLKRFQQTVTTTVEFPGGGVMVAGEWGRVWGTSLTDALRNGVLEKGIIRG